MISYRDYLIRTAALTARALNDAIGKALDVEHEGAAIRLLENRLDSVPELAEYKRPNMERVEPRP